MIKIHQALYSYRRGHELIKSSGANLTRAEEVYICGATDLAGYTPIGDPWQRYFSGYPAGRWYVFSSTWRMDTQRLGAVTTHALLLDAEARSALSGVEPWSLSRLFRRPEGCLDGFDKVIAFSKGADARATSALVKVIASESSVKAVRKMLDDEEKKPLVWHGERDDTESLFASVWAQLEDERRWRFSFCTWTASPRFTMSGAPLDLQGIPASVKHPFMGSIRGLRRSG